MAGKVIGVEIAEESIRAVQVSGGRNPSLLAAGEVLLPPGAARDSEVLDAEAVALALAQLWAQAGFRQRNVVLSVANRRLLVREHTVPNLPREQLRAALPYEVNDLLPVTADRAVIDFYPLAVEARSARGLLVAGPAEGIEGLIGALREVRIRVDSVDFLPFGLARAAGRVAPSGSGPVAVVAVGEHTTCFTVASDGVPAYVRIVPVDVLPGLHALLASADEFAEASPGRALLPGPRTASDPSLHELVGRVQETLQFCRRGGVGAPRRLFLTGAMAGVPEVQAALRGGIDLEVVPLAPADVVPVARHLQQSELPGSLMGALGVTLGMTR